MNIGESTRGTPPRILIVEDEWVVAQDLRQMLERSGYVVQPVASSVQAARERLSRDAPDLALLDIGLGTDTSFELATDLAQRGVPYVFVSGRYDAATLAAVGETRPAGFVIKPFTTDQLRVAVQIALAARRGEPYKAALERIAQVMAELGILPVSAPSPMRALPELSELSSREWEVLRELLAHRRVPAIARKLHISAATVRNHLKSIFAKVGVHSQQELLERLIRG